MQAFLALVPYSKLGKGAGAAYHKVSELLKNGKQTEAYRHFNVLIGELKHADVPLASAGNGVKIKVPKGGVPSHAMASKGKEHRIAKTLVNNRTKGISYQGSVIETLNLTGNTQKIRNLKTVKGEVVSIIPDATIDGIKGTLVEIKNVGYLSDTRQIRGYAATNQPILLVVHPRTKISGTVQEMVDGSKGKIQVFDPQTKKLTNFK